ncbi:hypothetical protein D9619_003917 [Psilocybe cf. subviscida]|uniref:HMG box domain-containing protein n=1 Tax=Psilocybe cf. subviscida TaxID=2480587 RepID=A0A8H5BQD2_9AGAR|nr:hypothetical protein D9619_003917 [Psilocybe cf. subviscida]
MAAAILCSTPHVDFMSWSFDAAMNISTPRVEPKESGVHRDVREPSPGRPFTITLPRLVQAPSPPQPSTLFQQHPSTNIVDQATQSSGAVLKPCPEHAPSLPESTFSLPSPPPIPTIQDSKTDEPHIPRPPNSFILFRQEYCRHYNRKGKRLTKNVSQAASEVWKSLSSAEKKYWQSLADEAKRAHREMYPGYKFKPQHSSKNGDGEKEKKARVRLASLSVDEIRELLSLDAAAPPGDAVVGSNLTPMIADSRSAPSRVMKLEKASTPTLLDLLSPMGELSPLWDCGFETGQSMRTIYSNMKSSSEAYLKPILTQLYPVIVDHNTQLPCDLDISMSTSIWDNIFLSSPDTKMAIDGAVSPTSLGNAYDSIYPFQANSTSSTWSSPNPNASLLLCPCSPLRPTSSSLFHEVKTPVLPSHQVSLSSPWNAHAQSESNPRALSEPPTHMEAAFDTSSRGLKLCRGSDDAPLIGISSVLLAQRHARTVSLPSM